MIFSRVEIEIFESRNRNRWPMTPWTHNIQLGHLKNFPFLQTNWNNIAAVMVANTKIGILVVVKIPNEDFTDSGDWWYMLEVEMEVDNVANVVVKIESGKRNGNNQIIFTLDETIFPNTIDFNLNHKWRIFFIKKLGI